MASLQARIEKSEDLKNAWPRLSVELTEWLKDLATSVPYTIGKSDQEVGITIKIIADLRSRIEQSTSAPEPAKPKIRRLSPIE
jgi:hypothetical protein